MTGKRDVPKGACLVRETIGVACGINVTLRIWADTVGGHTPTQWLEIAETGRASRVWRYSGRRLAAASKDFEATQKQFDAIVSQRTGSAV